MLLQTNSYLVPREKRVEHARLLARFRQTLSRLGCMHFEAYEQVGSNWSPTESTGRFVQIMRFRDRKHQLAVQAAERNDPSAQTLIREFCDLINFPYQQQQGLFAVGFYAGAIPMTMRDADAGNGSTGDPHEVPPPTDTMPVIPETVPSGPQELTSLTQRQGGTRLPPRPRSGPSNPA